MGKEERGRGGGGGGGIRKRGRLMQYGHTIVYLTVTWIVGTLMMSILVSTNL